MAFFLFMGFIMASVSLPAPLVPGASAVVAATPAALLARGDLPLPFSQPLAGTTGAAGADAAVPDQAAEGGAMRPDQAQIARQLAYAPPDAAALARSWRAMVRGHGAELTSRTLAASAGQLSPALLAAAAQGQVVRHAELASHPDAWRFTVHAGGAAPHHLALLSDEADPPGGRRKRARAALRLELTLADGGTVVLQIDPLPQGLAIALCAPDARALARLEALQPALEAALAGAGLKVLRWHYRDRLPAGRSHAMVASAEAAAQLTPAVFRAAAEMALLLPAATADLESGDQGGAARGR